MRWQDLGIAWDLAMEVGVTVLTGAVIGGVAGLILRLGGVL